LPFKPVGQQPSGLMPSGSPSVSISNPQLVGHKVLEGPQTLVVQPPVTTAITPVGNP